MYMIKAYTSVQDMTGIGIELLVDESGEYIRAEFIDGNFKRAIPKPIGNTEPTLILEEAA